jgi:phosphoenolpyruvate carboxykinase (ATP)
MHAQLQQINFEGLGIITKHSLHYNLPVATLYEHILQRGEGTLSSHGALIVRTTPHTGRSPKDKFIVREPGSEAHIHWGEVNRPISSAQFAQLRDRMIASMHDRDLYVLDCAAAADPAYRLRLRIVTERAWHQLFARNLFLRLTPDELERHIPEFTVIDLPTFKANPATDGTRSETFIIISFAERLILIGGTEYAGEIKKSIFTVLNYLLPQQGILSMHCSANVGTDGQPAVFFGLSGTGKTTLSADPTRTLIGDDEHGWSDNGIFNFEGGCYAKVIHLSQEAEPEIFSAAHQFGTLLENVVFDETTRQLDFNDNTLTENTRAAYPIEMIRHVTKGTGGHASHIIMLTADAFGVLPPISRLTPQQAMYHFLSGYTAKIAGTEKGVTEPQATFSACFGGPFMVFNPIVYAELLGQKILEHDVKVWLVNTGWSGGPYGIGRRINISDTRAIVSAALNGSLENVRTEIEPFFGLAIPVECPGVSAAILNPRNTWADTTAYDEQAKKLARMFHTNFNKFVDGVAEEVRLAGVAKPKD